MADMGFQLEMQTATMMSKKPPGLPGRGGNLDMDQARKVGEEYEAFFLGQMLRPMFEGIKAEEPFGGGAAENMWRSIQVDEIGKAIARSGGIGLADDIVRQMMQMQEVQNP